MSLGVGTIFGLYYKVGHKLANFTPELYSEALTPIPLPIGHCDVQYLPIWQKAHTYCCEFAPAGVRAAA